MLEQRSSHSIPTVEASHPLRLLGKEEEGPNETGSQGYILVIYDISRRLFGHYPDPESVVTFSLLYASMVILSIMYISSRMVLQRSTVHANIMLLKRDCPAVRTTPCMRDVTVRTTWVRCTPLLCLRNVKMSKSIVKHCEYHRCVATILSPAKVQIPSRSSPALLGTIPTPFLLLIESFRQSLGGKSSCRLLSLMEVLSIPDRQRGVLLVFLYFHSGDVLLMTRMRVAGAAY